MTSPIALVDLHTFTSPGSSSGSRLVTARSLVDALRTTGFAYISNHGVPPSLLEKAFNHSRAFFSLPQSAKMTCPHPPGWTVHRGYSWPGLEKVSGALSAVDDPAWVAQLRTVQDYKESFEVGSNENPDQPNVFPDPSIIPEFETFMLGFYQRLNEVARDVLRCIAVGLNLEEDYFLSFYSGRYDQLRLLHYPPVPRTVLTSGTMSRMPAHTDWSVLTLLFQSDMGGLQLKDRALGEFVHVPPRADTLVLNVGDLLMRWTNDELVSTMHRVVPPPAEMATAGPAGSVVSCRDGEVEEGEGEVCPARYSIPYFVTTDPDMVIECLGGKAGSKYEPMTQREYAAMRARMQY